MILENFRQQFMQSAITKLAIIRLFNSITDELFTRICVQYMHCTFVLYMYSTSTFKVYKY